MMPNIATFVFLDNFILDYIYVYLHLLMNFQFSLK